MVSRENLINIKEILTQNQEPNGLRLRLLIKYFQKKVSLRGELFYCIGMMKEKDVDEILKRYLNGVADEQEVKWIEQWYKSLDHYNKYPKLDEFQIQEIIHASHNKIQSRLKMDRARSIMRWWPTLAAAATVAILATVAIYNFIPNTVQSGNKEIASRSELDEQIRNETSLVKYVMLKDSTKVSLQPNSSIRITNDFNQNDRKIILSGEAFFNVSHNPSKPFYVEAGRVVTKVLGTSFNIRAFSTDGNITVKVNTGKVSVYTEETTKRKKDDRPLILTANQQAVYNEEESIMAKSIVENPKILLPEQEVKRLKFEAAPMAEVMVAIERAYGVEISFSEDDFSSCKLTTTLGKDGLFNRLDILCRAIGATYTQEDGRIVITGKGCE
jgi:transmembrane sensor